jgi:hypothetical protein
MVRILAFVAAFAVLLPVQSRIFAQEQLKEEKKEPEKKLLWSDNVTVTGDFRYRHETIKEENVTERNRDRVRVRVGAEVKLNDEVKFTLRLATGGADPVSTNQTLTEGFSRKSIAVDLAYFEWKPESVKGLSLFGGKMKNPLQMPGSSDLIWDSDLTPEGLAARYSPSAGRIEPFITAAGFSVEERSADPDAWLFAVQSGFSLKFGQNANVKMGAGYFDFGRAEGFKPFYDPTKGFGNTLDAGGNYANDYGELEGFVEYNFKAGSIPLSLFADYVKNDGASKDNTGYLAGFRIGRSKEPGDWSFLYNYRRLEKDAVIGASTDSDSWGGGTDGKGHKVFFEIVAAKNVSLGATAFFNKKTLDNETDYKRFQFDVVFKF